MFAEEALIIIDVFCTTCASIYFNAVTLVVYFMILHVIAATVYEKWKSQKNVMQMMMTREQQLRSEMQEREDRTLKYTMCMIEHREDVRDKLEEILERRISERMNSIEKLQLLRETQETEARNFLHAMEIMQRWLKEREDVNLDHIMKIIQFKDEQICRIEERFSQMLTETNKLHEEALRRHTEMMIEQNVRHAETLLAMQRENDSKVKDILALHRRELEEVKERGERARGHRQ